MTKPQIKEINCETGEEILRDMTDDELKTYKIDQANAKAKKDAENAQIAAKSALLERLGITADEAALLLQ